MVTMEVLPEMTTNNYSEKQKKLLRKPNQKTDSENPEDSVPRCRRCSSAARGRGDLPWQPSADAATAAASSDVTSSICFLQLSDEKEELGRRRAGFWRSHRRVLVVTFTLGENVTSSLALSVQTRRFCVCNGDQGGGTSVTIEWNQLVLTRLFMAF